MKNASFHWSVYLPIFIVAYLIRAGLFSCFARCQFLDHVQWGPVWCPIRLRVHRGQGEVLSRLGNPRTKWASMHLSTHLSIHPFIYPSIWENNLCTYSACMYIYIYMFDHQRLYAFTTCMLSLITLSHPRRDG